MLNQDTKQKIKNARDILVGKVPDPKAQVEQITFALIYKFMDDMDKQSQELPGGKAQFFTNGYEKYAWSKILDPKLGGHERLELYAEAITRMSENKHIPQLFRDVFKDAFLPYRSPETLSLFLKEINGFSYDHSEDLGDSFEYLLSVLGSQGDAGQFRTPRHIIDFIVEVVDPKKDESVLDPACGTAGFLISAYKHILKEHKNKPLNPDEKSKLMKNLVGYDISPDMVRLSKVNMYLHGFAEPKIYEYDTLSSEEKWDETYDVIMANPPFMTPKGGIRPHKRFSVQANRAEVLFVDYIKEHLRPNGRAGIIVPEGIIFQSGSAYKHLRKILVEDGLVGVISLPAGVFNPYSGVKTCILLFDNSLAKISNNIIFIKISNDGYDLGAQRREIEVSDLPVAQKIIRDYTNSIKSGKKHTLSKEDQVLAHIVPKEKISESGDYNLTGDRYREIFVSVNNKWPIINLGDVCDFSGGSQPPKEKFIYSPKDGYVRFIQIRDFGENGVETYIPISSKNKLSAKDDVFIARYGASLGRICTGLEGAYNVALLKAIPDTSRLNKKFLYYLLQSDYIQQKIEQYGARAAQAGVTPADLKPIKIPLPSIEAQEQIVKEIESKQAIIENAKELITKVERERANSGQIFERIKCDWVELGDFFEKVNDSMDPKKHSDKVEYIGLENIESNSGRIVGNTSVDVKTIKSIKNRFESGDILYGKLRPNLNKVWLADNSGICSTDILVLRKKNNDLSNKFYSCYFRTDKFNTEVLKGLKGAQLPRISFDFLSKIKIPLPDLETQENIASQFDLQQKAVTVNMQLVDVFNDQIKEKMAGVWGN
ncbi:MAG: N-6 DNA methylase [Candidatus Buchananbacteria bacterium]